MAEVFPNGDDTQTSMRRGSLRAATNFAAPDNLEPPPNWTREAVCATVDADLWFPEKGGGIGIAKSICARCPVKDVCLENALARHEAYGVWGGMGAVERKRLLKRMGRESAALLRATG